MPQFTTADRIGVIGGYLGAAQTLLGNGGIGNLFNAANTLTVPAAQAGVYVTQTELHLNNEVHKKDQELCAKDMEIVELRADKAAKEYTDSKVKPLEDKVCKLEAALAMEAERRACGDENIYSYVDGHFIPGELTLDSHDINYHGVEPVVRLHHHGKHCRRDRRD